MTNNRLGKWFAVCVLALALALAAGAAIPPALGQSDITPTPAGMTTRYQVVDDMLTLQQRAAEQARQIAALQNDVQVLTLLRAHDIQMNQRTRAEDQKRIAALEWAIAGQRWPACAR